MNLAFKSKLMRSLFKRVYSHEYNMKLKLTLNLTLNLRWNLDVNVDLIMLRLFRCPGILPDYGHCSVMIKW